MDILIYYGIEIGYRFDKDNKVYFQMTVELTESRKKKINSLYSNIIIIQVP